MRRLIIIKRSGSMKSTLLWPLGSLLAILAAGIIVLTSSPAVAYVKPAPVSASVPVPVDVASNICISYQPEPVEFEVTAADMAHGCIQVEYPDSTLKWCSNGPWQLNIWRSGWDILPPGYGDPNFDLCLGFTYYDPLTGETQQDPVLVGTTPKPNGWKCSKNPACRELTDFVWVLCGLTPTTLKGNYGCTVIFEISDP